MIRRKSFPVKKALLCFIAAVFGAGAFFIILLSGVSIRVGLTNRNQDGFFIPILAGGFSMAVCLILFIWFMKITFRIIREKGIFTSR
jgi:hypothetical protein